MWAERVVLSEDEVIETFLSHCDWRLAYLRRGATLLAYEGGAEGASRVARGNSRPYRFRSVEQLRYDFDRDVRALRDEDLQ